MHYKLLPPIAALAMAASMTLAGCGTPAKTYPGVGQPNPNGHGLVVVEGSKTPAETAANALRADIHNLKEFKKLAENCNLVKEYVAIFGEPKLAHSGPYAGSLIYPNLYYDEWQVSSICLMQDRDAVDLRLFDKNSTRYTNIPVYVTEIPFIRPDQAAWFDKKPEDKQ